MYVIGPDGPVEVWFNLAGECNKCGKHLNGGVHSHPVKPNARIIEYQRIRGHPARK